MGSVFETQRSTKIFQSIFTYIKISSTQSKRPRFVVIKMLKLVAVCALVVICSVSPNSAKPNCENDSECNEWEICKSNGQCGCPKCFRVGFPIPVCGTDGKSYRSKCELKEAACKTQNADLAVASQGKCAAARSSGGCKTCPTQSPTWPNC